MQWISIDKRQPKPLVKVWVKTDTGKQTTAYMRNNGAWFFFCKKVADENPMVIMWGE